MRLGRLLFAASVLLLLTFLGSFLVDPAARPGAEAHPEYTSLDRTLVGSSSTLLLGYAMGLGVIATIGAAVVMGVRKHGRSGALGRWLVVGFAVLAVIFTALVWSYTEYAAADGTDLFLSVPRPTAWMLFGIWLFPFLMIVAVMWHFNWFVTDDDEKRFEAMVERTHANDRTGD